MGYSLEQEVAMDTNGTWRLWQNWVSALHTCSWFPHILPDIALSLPAYTCNVIIIHITINERRILSFFVSEAQCVITFLMAFVALPILRNIATHISPNYRFVVISRIHPSMWNIWKGHETLVMKCWIIWKPCVGLDIFPVSLRLMASWFKAIVNYTYK